MAQRASTGGMTAGDVAGTRIGRYTLLGRIATGGMAEVFLARQDGPMGFSKTVVIKRILPQFVGDEQFLDMFLNEARLAALINHPHVVSIYELGEDPDKETYFIAMEYIDGRNLRQVATRALEEGGQLSLRVCAKLIADACAGLEFAHTLKDASGMPLNIVHRDISSENILVSYAGMVKVVDFGIAKAAHIEGRTRTGVVKGKYSYMSPEQLMGKTVDRRTDVWALGITLYWLLSGQRPFRGDSEGSVIQGVLNNDVPPLERRGIQVPAELEEIVRTALEKSVENRFQSAGELQQALERWIANSGEGVTLTSLATLMEQLYPAETDLDRAKARALLLGTGEEPNTIEASGPRASRKTQPPRAPPPRRRSKLVVYGTMAGLGTAVAAGLWFGLAPRDDPFPAPAVHRDLPLPLPEAESPPQLRPNAPEQPPAAEPPKGPTPSLPTTLAAIEATPRASEHRHAAAHVRKPAAEPSEEPLSTVILPGKLSVDARPWAAVVVDGHGVGTTPFAPIALPAGRHRLDLINSDLGVHLSRTVDIKAGETFSVREKLTAEPHPPVP